MIAPYIGVTGFTQCEDVWEALEEMPNNHAYNNLRFNHRLMVGVLMSTKTLAGIPVKYPARYPDPEEVGDIFVPDRRTFNLIHFNYADDVPQMMSMDLVGQMELAASFGGKWLDGFQLNMRWPEPHLIWRFKTRNPHLKLVLQIGAKAMLQVEQNVFSSTGGKDSEVISVALAQRIANYGTAIDAVLIDPSGGEGKDFDLDAANIHLSVMDEYLDLALGIAGGLSADKVINLRALNPRQICWDAEGKLREPESDEMDMAAVRAYIRNSVNILLS